MTHGLRAFARRCGLALFALSCASTPLARAQTADASSDVAAVPASRPIRVHVLAGAGIGSRSLRRPTPAGSQRLDESIFPALDVGLRVGLWPERAFSLALKLQYQTSIAWKVQDAPPFALGSKVSARAERLELTVAPAFRLSESPRAAVLALPLGFGMRTFWPDVHDVGIVGYSLLGPLLRAELALTLGDALALRFGPELHWIVAIDRAVQRDGASGQGIAAGGEVTMQVPLGRKLALELSYRQSHAFVPGRAGARNLVDVERFAVARISGAL